jgi:hypothetical protein
MLPRAVVRFTWAITIPPLLRAASATSRGPRYAPSCSIDRLPSSSAVVPRMIATSTGMFGKYSHSPPLKSTSSTT